MLVMKRLLPSLALAAVIAVAGSSAFAEDEVTGIQLEEAARVENAFAYYQFKAPGSTFDDFLKHNNHLGSVTMTSDLDVGTTIFVPFKSNT